MSDADSNFKNVAPNLEEASTKPLQENVKSKFILPFTGQDWADLFGYIRQNPQVVLFDRHIRIMIARRRAKFFGKTDTWAGDQSAMIDLTIGYNKNHMENFLESHVVRLLRPLSIIDPVYENAAKLKVLSIGPRNENELFHLYAHGFHHENIRSIDVVSNSPLIEVADMHDIPAADNSFDVVISGWTLPYSQQSKKAIAEKVRVLKPGGLLCIGLTRVPPDHPEAENLDKQGSANYISSQQILEDIGYAVGDVAFRHDPQDQSRKGAILVIVRIRK